MRERMKNLLAILLVFICSTLNAADNKELFSKIKTEYKKIDEIKSKMENSEPSSKQELDQIRNNIYMMKKQLEPVAYDINNPVYVKNNVKLDDNLDLIDFCMYEDDDDSYQVFVRLKNTRYRYLEWVKIRFNMYKNGEFTGTDYAYVDFNSYGSYGISPYNYSFIETLVDKVDFDSIAFKADYDIENREKDVLWDQVLKIDAVLIKPDHDNRYDWQGIVKNNFNYSMRFPHIYACVLKDNKMIALKYAYLDVPDYTMEPYSSAEFDSYLELPDSYDEIKYYIDYSLYSLEGSGNLPPNKPIFTEIEYSGSSRENTGFKAFLIDPDNDRIELTVDFGNGFTSAWNGNYISGYSAGIQYPYPDAGEFNMKAKASDGSVESQWSDSANVSITESTVPDIITTDIDDANYKKNYNFQLQSTGGIQPVSWKINSGTLPGGLVLDENSGLISGVPSSSGQYPVTLYCTDSGTPAISDSLIFNFEVKNIAPIIVSADTINTFVRTQISYTASAIDPDQNTVTYQFSNYPDWLTVSNNVIGGTTPNQILDTSFTLIATDGDLADTLVVDVFTRTQPLEIAKKDSFDAYYQKAYSDTLIAAGGLEPYSWSIVEGQLPDGLLLDDSGVISGIPDSSGVFQVTIQLQDSDNPPQLDSLYYELIVINNPPQITSPDTVSVRKQQDFLYTASATDPDGNEVNYTFINYPSWLTVSNSVLVGVVPLIATDASFTLIASDGDKSDTLQVNILIRIVPLVITSLGTFDAYYQKAYSDTLKATGGLEPYSWSIVEGQLPDGLHFDSTGVISGVPGLSGVFQVTIQLQDSDNPPQLDSLYYELNVINNPPQITSPDTVSVRKQQDFVYTASATDPDGNEVNYAFINYPSWLTVSNSVLVGVVPLTATDASFTLIASDGDKSDTLQVNILIRIVPLVITSLGTFDAYYQKAYSDTLKATGGLEPYSWSIVEGQLPDGLHFDSTGVISGVPGLSGVFQVTIQLQDSDNPPQLDSLYYELNVINNPPQITSPDTISIRKQQDFVYTASATDPDGNEIYYTFLHCPSWLTVSDSRLVGNVPLTASDTLFTLVASDGDLSDSLKVKITVNEVAGVNTTNVPLCFQISENYPNPFNATTNIKVDLPERSNVKLFVYNVNGKMVDKLYTGKLNAGSHTFSWNAINVSSGLYFIHFKSERFSKIIKCTLVK